MAPPHPKPPRGWEMGCALECPWDMLLARTTPSAHLPEPMPAASSANDLVTASCPAGEGGSARRPVVVHVTTVGLSLHTFLTGQASYMDGHGFEIHAVAAGGPDLDRFGQREGVPVHPVPMTRQISPLRDLVSLFRLWRELRRIRPQVVHAHSPKGGLLGMTAALLARVPARIYHIRGLPHATATGARRLSLVTAERVSCALAHKVLAVSRSMRELAEQDRLAPRGKIEVLLGGSGNGVDATGRFRPPVAEARANARAGLGIPQDALVVGFVGRVGRDKGMVELAEAWASLREAFPVLHLLLVGAHETEDPLPKGLFEALGRDPRVLLTGAVPDTSRLYGAMDVVALPSYREGMPNAALEAAATALPIVASRIPGCTDAILDGVTGALVPVRDAEALREALARYLREPELRRAHGEAARRRVLAEFGQEALWSAIGETYRALLARRGAPGRAGPRP